MCSLGFIVRQPYHKAEKPFELWTTNYPDHPRTNCVFETVDSVPFHDARQHRDSIGLSSSGFEFFQDSIDVPEGVEEAEWRPDDELAKICIRHAISLAESKLKPEKIICYDWRVGSSVLQSAPFYLQR